MAQSTFEKPLEVRGTSKKLAIRAHDGRLDVEGEPLGEIHRALLVPESPPFVRIESRDETLELLVKNNAEGRRLLRLIAHDAAEQEARFDWFPDNLEDAVVILPLPLAIAVLAVVVRSYGDSVAKVYAACLCACTLFVYLLYQRRNVITVGRDAVRFRGHLRKTVIPYDVLVDATPYEERNGEHWSIGVEVEVGKEGERRRFAVGSSGERTPPWMAKAIAQRIADAVDAWDAAAKPAPPPPPPPEVDPAVAFLARGSRSVRDWIQALRGLGGEASFRSAPIDADRLLAILHHAGATKEERSAAAVALGANEDPEIRDRVRVALYQVDDAKVRVVLDAVRDDDEAALEEALDEITK